MSRAVVVVPVPVPVLQLVHHFQLPGRAASSLQGVEDEVEEEDDKSHSFSITIPSWTSHPVPSRPHSQTHLFNVFFFLCRLNFIFKCLPSLVHLVNPEIWLIIPLTSVSPQCERWRHFRECRNLHIKYIEASSAWLLVLCWSLNVAICGTAGEGGDGTKRTRSTSRISHSEYQII